MPQVRNDEPIDSVVNDLFGFSFQASVIAKLVGGENSKNHLSVGVSGSWGSGKTSLLNMVRELLEYIKHEENFNALKRKLGKNKIKNISTLRKMVPFYRLRKEIEKKEHLKDIPSSLKDVKVIWFDPWFFGSEETVIKAFFYRIAKELMDEDKELAKLFLKLAVVMSSSPNLPESLPVVGDAFKVINYGRNLLNWMSGDDGSVMDFTDIKRKICERLKTNEFTYTDDEDDIKRKTRKRIVIIIDDLDRLQEGEALTMLKVIRLVTEFGVNFVIGYDEETLSATIDKNCGGHGREYIRKMMNVPTYIPSIRSKYLFIYLDKIISISSDTTPLSENNVVREKLKDICIDLIKTLRQTKKILNTYLLIKTNLPNQDTLIIFGVSLFLNLFPELFIKMKKIEYPFYPNQEHVCLFYGAKASDNAFKQKQMKDFEDTLNNDTDRIRNAKELCEILFNPTMGSRTFFEEYPLTSLFFDYNFDCLLGLNPSKTKMQNGLPNMLS